MGKTLCVGFSDGRVISGFEAIDFVNQVLDTEIRFNARRDLVWIDDEPFYPEEVFQDRNLDEDPCVFFA
jgi:hypothetical protein